MMGCCSLSDVTRGATEISWYFSQYWEKAFKHGISFSIYNLDAEKKHSLRILCSAKYRWHLSCCLLPEQKNRMMASVPASVMSLPGYVTTSGSSTRLSEHSALCTAVPSKCKIICKCEFHGRKHILATITKVPIFYLHFKLHFWSKRDFRRCMLVWCVRGKALLTQL